MEKIVDYQGILTQEILVSCMDSIENHISDISIVSNISTIFIEMYQNMMYYSKNSNIKSREIEPYGDVSIEKRSNTDYYISATNIISIEDKQKVEEKLIEIKSLDAIGIKKRYKELRKSANNAHKKGAGIGIYLLAKISDDIEYAFEKINDEKYFYTLSAKIISKY